MFNYSPSPPPPPPPPCPPPRQTYPHVPPSLWPHNRILPPPLPPATTHIHSNVATGSNNPTFQFPTSTPFPHSLVTNYQQEQHCHQPKQLSMSSMSCFPHNPNLHEHQLSRPIFFPSRSAIGASNHSPPSHRPDNAHEQSSIHAAVQGADTELNTTAANIVELRCEPCDKIFTTLTALRAHEATHTKCSISSCSFVGSKKVVAVHFELTHGAFSGNGYKMIEVDGMNFKVLMGTDSKEVAEWRSERRKKFPTRRTTDEKLRNEEQRLQAGGLLSEGQKGLGVTRLIKKRERESFPLISTSAAGDESPSKQRKIPEYVPGVVVNESSSCDVIGEQGSPPSDMMGETVSLQEEQPVVQQSGEGDGSEMVHEVVATSNGDGSGAVTSFKKRNKLCLTFERKGKCKFGKKCHFRHDDEGKGTDWKGAKKDGGNTCYKNPKEIFKTSNLYGKLVQHEVEKEDNMILQCLRYFVRHTEDFATM